mmetsp:Transcript_10901/g.17858  ORF Transcript_10901/g.17858 Transcript_10901/m.17858 type:complete len:184 (-) Transcript_10901:10-561(-)
MSAKIIVIGPEQSGKSTIANMLANVDSAPQNDQESLRDLPYRPTAGVRVVEFEVKLSNQQARNWGGEKRIEVELWDCSGNTKYEACWAAIQKNVDGVLLVYNPENPGQSGEVETWYEWFVQKAKLKSDQCLIFANDRNSGHDDPRGKPPPAFEEVEFMYTDAEDSGKMRAAVEDLVGILGRFK